MKIRMTLGYIIFTPENIDELAKMIEAEEIFGRFMCKNLIRESDSNRSIYEFVFQPRWDEISSQSQAVS